MEAPQGLNLASIEFRCHPRLPPDAGHHPSEEAPGKGDSLFIRDQHLLRFVLAGACAPTFLQGSIQPEGESKNNKKLARAGFDLGRSVVLSKMPKDVCNERAFANILRAAGIPPPRQGAFQQLSDDRAAIEMPPHELDGFARSDGRPGSEKMVEDLAMYVKLLIQLHVSNQRKLVLPNPRGAFGGSDATVLVKGLAVERQVGRGCVCKEPRGGASMTREQPAGAAVRHR